MDKIKSCWTLYDKVCDILKEKEPGVFHSREFKEGHGPFGFMWNGAMYALRNSRPETRKDIVDGIANYCRTNNDEIFLATIFVNYSKEEERLTPDHDGNVYSSEIDLTINPSKLYNQSMEKGRFENAAYAAKHFGLGKKEENAAIVKHIRQSRKKREIIPEKDFKYFYNAVKENGLDTHEFKEIARYYYGELMEIGEIDKISGWFKGTHYDEAKKVAEEADLGQAWIEKAEKEKPGLWDRLCCILFG